MPMTYNKCVNDSQVVRIKTILLARNYTMNISFCTTRSCSGLGGYDTSGHAVSQALLICGVGSFDVTAHVLTSVELFSVVAKF